ncbi:hypothetical protein OSTOST_25724, partial [Ostertagia ostertagi]
MRRPSDRRSYIAQPIERSSERHSGRRRSRDSRDRRDHNRRPSTKYEHHELHPVDMQICYGSDDEDLTRGHHANSDRDPRYDHIRKAVERGGAPDEPLLPPEDHVREGIVFEYLNYYEFLRNWIDECNRNSLERNKSALPKRVNETITPTTPAEKARIILPAGVFERDDLLHCDMIIGGLPPSVFFGSGFGHKYDLLPLLCRDLPRRDYDLAMDALINLDEKISVGKVIW